MNIEYTNINGYLIPNLYIAGSSSEPFGRYGRMRERYLQEHDSLLLDLMLFEGTLNRHLAEVDAAATQAVTDTVDRMAKEQSVDNALRRSQPLAWVQQMNTLKATAEECVLPGLLYPEITD